MINLKIARMKKGITQVQLGRMLGVGKDMVSRYETGRAKPTIYNLFKMAGILETTVDYLMEDAKNGRMD